MRRFRYSSFWPLDHAYKHRQRRTMDLCGEYTHLERTTDCSGTLDTEGLIVLLLFRFTRASSEKVAFPPI